MAEATTARVRAYVVPLCGISSYYRSLVQVDEECEAIYTVCSFTKKVRKSTGNELLASPSLCLEPKTLVNSKRLVSGDFLLNCSTVLFVLYDQLISKDGERIVDIFRY